MGICTNKQSREIIKNTKLNSNSRNNTTSFMNPNNSNSRSTRRKKRGTELLKFDDFSIINENEEKLESNKMHMNSKIKIGTNEEKDEDLKGFDEYYKLSDYMSDQIINNIKLAETSNSQIIMNNNILFDDYQIIEHALNNVFFINKLEKYIKDELIKAFSLVKYASSSVIYSQGSISEYFYIIKSGNILEYIDFEYRSILTKGNSFGESGLLFSTERTNTMISKDDVMVWVINKKKYKEVLECSTEIRLDENKDLIHNIKILRCLDMDQKLLLCENLILKKYNKDEYIIREGDVGDSIFIIKSGKVVCSKDNKQIRTLEKGSFFGEVSILKNNKRTLDVIAKMNCEMYMITKEMLSQMIGSEYINVLYLNYMKSAFSNSKLLSSLSTILIEKIFPLFEKKSFLNSDIVFEKGYDISKSIVIIVNGCLYNQEKNTVFFDLNENEGIPFQKEIISKESLFLEENVVSRPDCLLMLGSITQIEKFIGGELNKIIELSNIINCLYKVNLFKNFTYQKIKQLSEKTSLMEFQKGSTILKNGEVNRRFYFIKQGKVVMSSKGNLMKILQTGEYFGEKGLFSEETVSEEWKAQVDTVVFYIDSVDFQGILDENFKKYLKSLMILQDKSIKIDDLKYVKEIETKNESVIHLVISETNNSLYALKQYQLKKIHENNMYSNLENQKKVLEKIEHPFIIKMVKVLKTNKSLLFLYEYVKSKELFDVIREIGILDEYQSKFYSASLIIACNYLHKKKIIYRDIKPENIVVDENVSNILCIYLFYIFFIFYILGLY